MLNLNDPNLFIFQADNSRSCFTSTFEIDSVQPEDSGIVSFIVANSKGLDDVELSLNVTRAGFFAHSSSSSVHPLRFPSLPLIYVTIFLCLFHRIRAG